MYVYYCYNNNYYYCDIDTLWGPEITYASRASNNTELFLRPHLQSVNNNNELITINLLLLLLVVVVVVVVFICTL